MNPNDKFTCTKCDGTRKLYWVDYRSGFPFKSESPCDLCAWFPPSPAVLDGLEKMITNDLKQLENYKEVDSE